MISRVISTLFIVHLFITTGCSDINIKADDAGNSFNRYATYSWYKDVAPMDNTNLGRTMHEEVIQLVDTQLTKKGYSASAAPDFYVNYKITVEDKFNVKKLNVYSGVGPGFVWRADGELTNESRITSQEIEIVELREGTMVIDIIDAKTGKLVWRGTAQREAEATLRTKEERSAVLTKAVHGILRGVPRAL